MSKSKKGEPIEELQATNEKAAELVNAGFSEAIATTDPKDERSSEENTSPVQTDASAGESGTDAPSSEEPTTPEAAQLLATADDDSDRMKAVKTAAEEGWNAFGALDGLSGKVGNKAYDSHYGDLSALERLGLQTMVLAIVNNPHADTVAGIMADNNDRRTVRILDNELRRALGYSVIHYN